jgi:hypothetical protein
MGFAQKGFTNQPDAHSSRRSLDRSAQACSARANDKNIVLESFVISHALVER